MAKIFLEAHEQRVVHEKTELDEKLSKLRAFFHTPIYERLEDEEKERLQRQVRYMDSYSSVLGERISAFK